MRHSAQGSLTRRCSWCGPRPGWPASAGARRRRSPLALGTSMKVFRDSLVALLILTGSASCASGIRPQPAAAIVGSGVFVSDSGQTIRADYRDDGTVTLTFTDGTTKVLSQAVSASGARYVSGLDEWWEHQGEARYSVSRSRRHSFVPSAACWRCASTRCRQLRSAANSARRPVRVGGVSSRRRVGW